MDHLNKYIKKIIFFLGFLSALPFFFITIEPFVHFNFFYSDIIWSHKLTLYPGYTGSLYNLSGLSSPFILPFLFIYFCWFIFFFKDKKENLKLIILGIFLVIINTLILYTLSSSIKSLGASSSLIGLFMILTLMNNINFKIYSKGFLVCLSIFINLHALSILCNGIKVSYSIHGTSIFGIEIYQSLVSYVLVVSFFLATLILKKETFDNLFKFENKKFNYILYLITLFSCVIIIVFLARRLSFLIFLISVIIWFVIYLKNIKNRPFSWIFLIVSIFFSIVILLNKFFFTGSRAINYVDMIEPRFNSIVYNLSEIFNSSGRNLYFGKLKGWGNIESGFIDIFLNTGLIGSSSYLCTFIFLIYFVYKKLNILILKNNFYYILFSFFILLITNIVNNSISTPYFFVSFFIILVTVLKNNKPATIN